MPAHAAEPASRRYDNKLTPIQRPRPILADYPDFVEPVREKGRFEGPPVVDDANADLDVRAWRFSYNARGIVEVPNRLKASQTAIVVVHPWGIDDSWGWRSPEPAGVAFHCTPEKNRIYHRHVEQVLNPFLKSLRDKVALIAYSLPGSDDPIRKQVYRSVRSQPTEAERKQGTAALQAWLKDFPYKGTAVGGPLELTEGRATADYFRQFPGLDAGDKFNGKGFWQLPIPVTTYLDVDLKDVVVYDAEGYETLKKFLKGQGIRHVLLTGYATDMCLCSTTAGYKNLAPDFNLFVVGDATQATFPASDTPRFATNTALTKISLDHFVTQVSWVRPAVTKGK
jgi:hypothetical protein